MNVRTKVFTSIETVEGIIVLINSFPFFFSTKHSMSLRCILKDILVVLKHELDNHTI